MNLPNYSERHLAKEKVLAQRSISDGVVITPAERLTAARELAGDVVNLAYAIREGTPVTAVTDRLTANLRRILTFTSACVEGVIPTRTTPFRSGGIVAQTVHRAAVLIGQQALDDARRVRDWPERDELLAELEVEYTNAYRALASEDRPDRLPPMDQPFATEDDLPPEFLLTRR